MNRPVAGLPVTGRSTGPDRSNGRPAGLKCGPGPDRTGTAGRRYRFHLWLYDLLHTSKSCKTTSYTPRTVATSQWHPNTDHSVQIPNESLGSVHAYVQWPNQEFLSIGQFSNQIILKIEQPWTIEKSTRLQFFKSFQLFQGQCLLDRKVNNPQPTDGHIRCLCTTVQNYFSTLKCLIIFYMKTTTMTIFFLLSNTDGYPIWKLNRYKKLFATDVKAFARRFFSKQIF